MLDKFTATMGGWNLPSGIEHVAAADVRRFCDSVLNNPNRTVPVVVVSPDTWSERPLVDPHALWNAIRGSGHVAVLATKWAAFKLTDVVEAEYSCYNGAVRIYWPGFALGQNPFWHRRFLPAEVRDLEISEGLGALLFRVVAGIASFRYAEGRVTRSARTARSTSEQLAADQLRSAVERGVLEKNELEAQLLAAWEKNAVVERELEQMRSELDAQKEAWASYSKEFRLERPATVVDGGAVVAAARFDSVASAYAQAKRDFAGPLVFLDSAERSAAESPYEIPERVYELFEALHLVASNWRKGNGALGQSWEKALEELGFEYKAKISQTSKGRYGDDYMFVYKDTKVLCEQHITIGAKTPDTCLSVHWHRDDDVRVLAVGHCGRHLTNTKT